MDASNAIAMAQKAKEYLGENGVENLQNMAQNALGGGDIQGAITEKLQQATGLDPTQVIPAVVQNLPELSKIASDPIGTITRIAKNLSNAKTVGKGLEEGAKEAVLAVVEPPVKNLTNNIQTAIGDASNVVTQPLTPEQNIQHVIDITVIVRNIFLVLVIIWGVIVGIRKYSNLLPDNVKQGVDDINDFFHTYSGIITLILVVGSILSIIIYVLPYLSSGLEFAGNLQKAANVLINGVSFLPKM